MAHDCTICGFELTEYGDCLACDLTDRAIRSGACHENYHEALAEQIGNVLRSRNWAAKPIDLNKPFPRFA